MTAINEAKCQPAQRTFRRAAIGSTSQNNPQLRSYWLRKSDHLNQLFASLRHRRRPGGPQQSLPTGLATLTVPWVAPIALHDRSSRTMGRVGHVSSTTWRIWRPPFHQAELILCSFFKVFRRPFHIDWSSKMNCVKVYHRVS
jgi:hypothetical protein